MKYESQCAWTASRCDWRLDFCPLPVDMAKILTHFWSIFSEAENLGGINVIQHTVGTVPKHTLIKFINGKLTLTMENHFFLDDFSMAIFHSTILIYLDQGPGTDGRATAFTREVWAAPIHSSDKSGYQVGGRYSRMYPILRHQIHVSYQTDSSM